ncbi:MAG: hypothetical protein IT256_03785 [Chitinophagaceae bacterium]|nr:hypothetical protein [Chitinophagaceae bacterium]
MNWSKQQKQSAIQTQLLLNLSDEEQILIDILQKKDITHTDELMQLSGQGSSVLASTLLMLEMQGLVKSLPGKHYRMN